MNKSTDKPLNAIYIYIYIYDNFALWTSLIFTVLLYMQCLKSGSMQAGFINLGDVSHLWLPQLVATYINNVNFNFWGIDFATAGGASEFFLRPNIPAHNPLILLISWITNPVEPKHYVGIMVWVLFIHSFLSCFFTQKLCREFFGLDKYLSLFVAVGYSFSFYMVCMIGFPPFLLITLMLPVAIYSSLYLVQNFSIRRLFFCSLPIFMIFTGGYVAIAVSVTFIAALFSIIYITYIGNSEGFQLKGNILRIMTAMSPFALATIIAMPLYVSILEYYHLTTADGSVNLEYAAHQLAEKPHQILRLLSTKIGYEGPVHELNLVWGLIPVSIFVLFILSAKKENDFKGEELRLLQVSAIFYFVVMLVIFGDYSALSDMFYHLLPGIGSMHIYQRHLIAVNLFLMLFIALLFKAVLGREDIRSYKYHLAISVLLLIVVAHLVFYGRPVGAKPVFGEDLVFELILVTLFSISLFIFRRKAVVLITTFLMFMIPADYMYNFSSVEHWKTSNLAEKLIVFNKQENEKLINYFKANSDKEKVKYINLTPDFHGSYIPKNYPWYVKDKINLSSYYGYDLHISMPIPYRETMRTAVHEDGKWNFYPDWEWLKKTGAEFVIYQEGNKHTDENMRRYVDLSDESKLLRLAHNTVVAPLKFTHEQEVAIVEKEENTLDGRDEGQGQRQEQGHIIFDNGYIRAYSSDKNAKISEFQTDEATRISFSTDSEATVRVEYLFWPNKRLVAEINYQPVEWIDDDGMLSLDIPAGENSVVIEYRNIKMKIFMILYFLYFAALAYFLVQIVYSKYLEPRWRKT